MKNKILAIVVLWVFANSSLAQCVSNVSARVDLTPGGTYIFGFVVPQDKSVSLLLRAVGPSLKLFGVTNPAALPVMKMCDFQGRTLYVPPVATLLPTDWSGLFPEVGAFPLASDDKGSTFNFATFPPGSYTITVSDAANKGGTVLFELYKLSVPFGGPAPTVSLSPFS
jgi:hypothetical protein